METDGSATSTANRECDVSLKESRNTNVVVEGEDERDHEKQSISKKPFFLLDRETDDLDIGMENKNTLRKTDTDIRIVIAYLKSMRESRPPELISPIELDKYLTNFFGTVRKHDGNEYEPASLRGMLCSIERHLKMKHYPASVTRDFIFSNTRRALKVKQQNLRDYGKGAKKLSENFKSLSLVKINELYDAKEMGPYTPMSVINTLCFTIIVHFRLRKAIDHKNLLWGDIKLKSDQNGKEYLRYEPISTLQPRSLRKMTTKVGKTCVVPASINAERDPIKIYKFYAEKRPSNLNYENAPFYLGITTMYPSSMQAWYRTCAMGVNKLSELVRMIREITGISKSSVDYPVNSPLTKEYSKVSIKPLVELQSTRLESMSDQKVDEHNGTSLQYQDRTNLERDTDDSSSLSNDDDEEDVWDDESFTKSSGEVTESKHTSLTIAKTYFSQMIQRLHNNDVIKFREWLSEVEICTDPVRGHGICREKFADQLIQRCGETADGSDLVKVEKKIEAKHEDISSAKITLNITLSPRSLLGRGPITVTASSNKDIKQKTEQLGVQDDVNKTEKNKLDSFQATSSPFATLSDSGLSALNAKRRRSVDSVPMNLVCRQKYPRDQFYNGGTFDLFQHGLPVSWNPVHSNINQENNTSILNRMVANIMPPLAHGATNTHRTYQRDRVAVTAESLSCSKPLAPSGGLTNIPDSGRREKQIPSTLCPPRVDEISATTSSQSVSISCNLSSLKH